ncbi:hypothetical protein Mapa_014641 [Marchantia paleacea]|nr:hypothetical protein Mapa_014641 [Marchantia paleacea]
MDVVEGVQSVYAVPSDAVVFAKCWRFVNWLHGAVIHPDLHMQSNTRVRLRTCFYFSN